MTVVQSVHIRCVHGNAVRDVIPALADLRIRVFREYPYLYDGSLEYEADYLKTYEACPRSLVVLAEDHGRIVGASTAMPLADYGDEVQIPFLANGYDLNEVFYLGESVLEPAYRGRGLGVRFFDEREAYALRLGGFRWAVFCAVVRAADDPRRPAGYAPLDGFWQRRGYEKRPELATTFSWKELDEPEETPKPMTFWRRALPTT